jgi:membrane fusion protein, multidrug efflux system
MSMNRIQAAMVSLVIASTCLLVLGCRPQAKTAAEPPRTVRVMEAKPYSRNSSFVLPGEVRARWETRLAFRVSGQILTREVEIGQAVKKGQTLTRLDPTDYRLAVLAQEANHAAAEAELRLLKLEQDRIAQLRAKNLASESEADQRLAALRAGEARVEASRAQLSQTRHQAVYATLVADDDGVVTALEAEAGQFVAAGQTVIRLARTGAREIAVSVPESQLAAIRRAQTLEVRLTAFPHRLWSGQLRELAPAADPATRTFAARIAVPAGDADLILGMSASVTLVSREREQILLPLGALHTQDDQPGVWLVKQDDRSVERVPITTAGLTEEGVLVSAGVPAGAWVVIAGAPLLRPGQRVQPLFEGRP